MKRWIEYNPNPIPGNRVGDCAIRACCKATGRTWDIVFWDLCDIAFEMVDGCNSSNAVWGGIPKTERIQKMRARFPYGRLQILL